MMRGLLSIGLFCLLCMYTYITFAEPSPKNESPTDTMTTIDEGVWDWLHAFVQDLGDEVIQIIQDLRMDLFKTIIQQEQADELYEAGFSYQDILKLHLLSRLSQKDIDEILAIEESVIVNEEGVKRVNLYVLIDALGLSNEDIKRKIRDFAEEFQLIPNEKK